MTRRFDIFLSHSHADADLVESVATQLDGLGIACFLDQWEMVPGESSVTGLELGMDASNAVAVLVAAHGTGRWHAEEARQALKQSIDEGKRAFVVWMPGTDHSDVQGLPGWLLERTHVDLRGRIVEGRVTRDGLVQLVAGALGINSRKARRWLDERLAESTEGG